MVVQNGEILEVKEFQIQNLVENLHFLALIGDLKLAVKLVVKHECLQKSGLKTLDPLLEKMFGTKNGQKVISENKNDPLFQ